MGEGQKGFCFFFEAKRKQSPGSLLQSSLHLHIVLPHGVCVKDLLLACCLPPPVNDGKRQPLLLGLLGPEVQRLVLLVLR